MIKMYILKTIFVLTLSIFFSFNLFSQVAVVGFAAGKDNVNDENLTTFPSNLQLDKLSHVIAADIGCLADGAIHTGQLPNFWQGTPPPLNIWNNSKNEWLENLVNRAHAKGVNASISVGGDYFIDATDGTNINTFVGNIISFVNVHGFDGVNINWEYPTNEDEWNQCVALLNSLKNNLPSGKRLTIALSHSIHVYSHYTHVPQQILSIVDGIYLMTYDEGDSAWPSHSDVEKSIDAINEWITWGTPTCEQKKKLFLGSAFYGWHPVVGGTRVSYRDFKNGTSWSNPGDVPADVQDKAIHTRDNGFGGVFIWELGNDVSANHPQSLLKAISDVMPSLSGPLFVCNTNTPFTLNNLPEGSTVSWSRSGNLAYVDGQGTDSYILKAATAFTSGNGWVQAVVNGPCGSITLPRKNVWVGIPSKPISIHFTPNEPCLNQIVIATAFANNPTISGVQYTWWGSHNYINMNPSGSQVNFTTLSSYPYLTYVYVRGNNVCGNSANYSQLLSVKSCGGGGIPPSPVVISPNPTSTEVNINISLENSNDLFATSNNFDTENYEIAIYNISGVIMYKARMNNPSLKIDVSNWMKGVYVVKIFDGTSSVEGSFIVE